MICSIDNITIKKNKENNDNGNYFKSKTIKMGEEL